MCVRAQGQGTRGERGQSRCVPLLPLLIAVCPGLIAVSLQAYSIVLLGGLTGRLDQTIHTLAYLHKLRRERAEVFVITDENISWVLDEVSRRHALCACVQRPECFYFIFCRASMR